MNWNQKENTNKKTNKNTNKNTNKKANQKTNPKMNNSHGQDMSQADYYEEYQLTGFQKFLKNTLKWTVTLTSILIFAAFHTTWQAALFLILGILSMPIYPINWLWKKVIHKKWQHTLKIVLMIILFLVAFFIIPLN